jgi:hypothetical protein
MPQRHSVLTAVTGLPRSNRFVPTSHLLGFRIAAVHLELGCSVHLRVRQVSDSGEFGEAGDSQNQ